jgi:solute carrier family 25 (mitochondrial folate transporter), member 32
MDKKDSSHPAWKHLTAGCFSGVAASFVTTPLDVVKTRLQNQRIPLSPAQSNSIPFLFNAGFVTNGETRNFIPSPKYQGTVPSIYRIWRAEGLRGLYKGLYPTVIGYFPSLGIYFGIYGKSKQFYTNRFPDNPAIAHLISAVTASVFSTTLTNPLWVVRTRMMLREKNDWIGTWPALKKLWRKEGIRGIYSGLGPSLLGVTHVAINFPIYEKLKSWQHERNHTDRLSLLQILECSIVAKICATLTTYPHEVLRTRIQNQRVYHPDYVHYGVIGTAKRMWAQEGIKSFYRGLPTTILRVVPANSITFLTYESVLAFLGSL